MNPRDWLIIRERPAFKAASPVRQKEIADDFFDQVIADKVPEENRAVAKQEFLNSAAPAYFRPDTSVQVSPSEAAYAGIANAATLGLAPQATSLLYGTDPNDARAALQSAQAQQPGAFIGGSVLGGAPYAALAAPAAAAAGLPATGLAGAATAGAGVGALQGIGAGVNRFPETPVEGAMFEVAKGGVLGGLAGAAGSAAASGVTSLLSRVGAQASRILSGLHPSLSKKIFQAARDAKSGSTFSEQLDEIEKLINFRAKNQEGFTAAQAKDALEAIDIIKGGVSARQNALMGAPGAYALKVAMSGFGGSLLGPLGTIGGAVTGAVGSSPASSALGQQLLGAISSPAASLAGAATAAATRGMTPVVPALEGLPKVPPSATLPRK